MVSNELYAFWRQEELKRGELISVHEVAEATGLNWETVSNLKKGSTKRLDTKVLAKICEHFGIPAGQPVPFLVIKEVQKPD